VIIATVNFGPEAATPAAAVAPDDEADPDFPPEDEHAVNANDAAESATTAPTTRLERIMISCLSIVAAASRRHWMGETCRGRPERVATCAYQVVAPTQVPVSTLGCCCAVLSPRTDRKALTVLSRSGNRSDA